MSIFDDVVGFVGETLVSDKFGEILKDSKKLSKLVKRSATATELIALQQTDMKLRGDLNKIAKNISSIGKQIGKGANLLSKARAIYRIYQIMSVLDADIIREEPELSANVFGDLFYQLGVLAEALPPPANSYAKVLKAAKMIFVGTQAHLDPLHPRTERGQELQGYLDADDDLFTPK